MKFDFKKIRVHLLALAAFLLVAVVYFFPQFQGKEIFQSDVVQYRSMSQEIREHNQQYDDRTLWTNSMFGGMPTYQINAIRDGNQLNLVEKVMNIGLPLPAGQFIAAMIAFYILLIAMGVSPWLSIIGAIAFGFTTNNLILYEAGHVTKVKAISYLPLVALGLFWAFRGRFILGGLVFALGMGMDLMANHIQMTYYLSITLPIWAIAEFIAAQKKGQLPTFFKGVGALAVGGLLAIASVASNLWVTYEYSKDTMRGEPILEAAAGGANDQNSSEVDGLAWDYAMQWSNGALDLFSVYIPGAAGGSTSETISRDAPFAQALSRLGANIGRTMDAPLYFGALPFTSGPSYFGAIVILFFLMGLVLVKGPVKWWIALGTLLTLLMSLGKNLEGFNHFLFDTLPLLNKFRTPNSILSVTAFLVPVLSFLALQKIISGEADKAEVMRSLKIGGGIAAGIALFFAAMGTSFFDFANPADAARLNQMLGGQGDPQIMASLQNALIDSRQELMRSDAIRCLVLVLLAAAAVYFYLQEKLKLPLLLGAIALLTLFDLVGVGTRYLSSDDFVSERIYDQNFQPRPVDEQIMADTDPHYRVFDLTVPSPFESASASYFHRSLGGYHAAKLQRFQDMADRYLGAGNQQVVNMFNTKYIIVPGQDGQPVAQQNPGALGNAWFVDSLVVVNSNNAEIDGVGQIDPGRAAVIHQEFQDYISGLTPNGEGSISLTEYRANRLTYTSNSNSEQLAVFSEVWYGPDKGWKAYIDGEAVDHIRVDYILRALRIPAGQHEIVFEFEPDSYFAGVKISAASSILILLALIGWGVWYYRNKPEAEVATAEVDKPVAKAAKPARKKKKK